MSKTTNFPVLNPQPDTQPWRFNLSKSREQMPTRSDANCFVFATSFGL